MARNFSVKLITCFCAGLVIGAAAVIGLFPPWHCRTIQPDVDSSSEGKERCEETTGESEVDKEGESSSEEELSPEQRQARQMRAALDSGDIGTAVRLARSLMYSEDRDIRLEVVQTFAWCGRKTIPELIRLISDKDPGVSDAAYDGWKTAMTEVSSERVRAIMIENAVSNIDDVSKINDILMELTSLSEHLSLTTLEHIILKCRGRAASVCAKELFEHQSGEPWASPERTKLILNSMR